MGLKTANAKGLLDVPQLRKALEDNRTVEGDRRSLHAAGRLMAHASIWPIKGRVDKGRQLCP